MLIVGRVYTYKGAIFRVDKDLTTDKNNPQYNITFISYNDKGDIYESSAMRISNKVIMENCESYATAKAIEDLNKIIREG